MDNELLLSNISLILLKSEVLLPLIEDNERFNNIFDSSDKDDDDDSISVIILVFICAKSGKDNN